MKNDGGKAFPEIISDKDGTGQYDTYSFGGMTLRDYFAGQAIAGIFSSGKEISSNGVKIHEADQFAELAYNIADAMLVERDKK